eukprot:11913828-Ditylum_brightwellii.AAC.2
MHQCVQYAGYYPANLATEEDVPKVSAQLEEIAQQFTAANAQGQETMSHLATTNAQLQQQVYNLQQQINIHAGQMKMLAMTNNQHCGQQKTKDNNNPAGQQYQPPIPMQTLAQYGYVPSGVQQAQLWAPQQHGFHPQQYQQQNI